MPGNAFAAPRAPSRLAGSENGFWLHWQQPFALQFFAGEFAGAAQSLCLFPRALLRGLFIVAAQLHLAKYAFPLHLFLEGFESLVDIVIADENLHAEFLRIEPAQTGQIGLNKRQALTGAATRLSPQKQIAER